MWSVISLFRLQFFVLEWVVGRLTYFFNDLVFFVFRAVYLNTDIYLLDDIFSCVDNPTRQDMMKGSVTQTSLMVVD